MDRDSISWRIDLVQTLAEDWGRVLRACSSPLGLQRTAHLGNSPSPIGRLINAKVLSLF